MVPHTGARVPLEGVEVELLDGVGHCPQLEATGRLAHLLLRFMISLDDRDASASPAPLVKRGYQLAGIDKYVMKPWTILTNLNDRDLLAQIEAVDQFMDSMHAYPGRTFGQLYHRFFRSNDLADGKLSLTGRTLDLADVRVPVLAVAGRGDGIAPAPACHHVADLLPNAASVQLETAPGGRRAA